MRIEWHEDAVGDLRRLARPVQKRIRDYLAALSRLEDPRQRAEPYKGPLRGFWKLRVGDYRLICTIETGVEVNLLIVLVAHRSGAYGKRSLSTVRRRRGK